MVLGEVSAGNAVCSEPLMNDAALKAGRSGPSWPYRAILGVAGMSSSLAPSKPTDMSCMIVNLDHHIIEANQLTIEIPRRSSVSGELELSRTGRSPYIST
jgi:hypothetical protein